MNSIPDYEEIELGNRKLLATPISGHTPGSIMMYDERSKSLFYGDSVARRILYGLSGWTPLSVYLGTLMPYEKKEAALSD